MSQSEFRVIRPGQECLVILLDSWDARKSPMLPVAHVKCPQIRTRVCSWHDGLVKIPAAFGTSERQSGQVRLMHLWQQARARYPRQKLLRWPWERCWSQTGVVVGNHTLLRWQDTGSILHLCRPVCETGCGHIAKSAVRKAFLLSGSRRAPDTNNRYRSLDSCHPAAPWPRHKPA